MTRSHIELVRERDLLAEVSVTLIEDGSPDSGWGPYLSLEDAKRVERVRAALSAGDVSSASRDARVYRVTAEPV